MVLEGPQVPVGLALVNIVNPERSFIARWCWRAGLPLIAEKIKRNVLDIEMRVLRSDERLLYY